MSATVLTLSSTESAGSVPVVTAYWSCSITPLNACGNHIVSQVGDTHFPPVVAFDAKVSVEARPVGQPVVPCATPSVPSTRHLIQMSESKPSSRGPDQTSSSDSASTPDPNFRVETVM